MQRTEQNIPQLIRHFIVLALCMMVYARGNSQHLLNIRFTDKDNAFKPQPLKIQTSFSSAASCAEYINVLPALLGSKGYPTASVDSIADFNTHTDIQLFLGKQYRWIKLRPSGIEKKAIEQRGFAEKNYSGKLLNIQQLQLLEERILNYYENNG
jgi:hypothetical protein